MFQKKYNVFNEWGTKIGEFTVSPNGTNILIGLFLGVILWTVGFLLFLVFKGVVCLFQGKIGEGLAYLAGPATLVLVIVFSNQAAAAQDRAYKQSAQATYTTEENEVEQIRANPNMAVTLRKIGKASKSEASCGEYSEYDDSSWYEYQVTNTTRYTSLYFEMAEPDPYSFALNNMCHLPGCYELAAGPFNPGETINFYCVARIRSSQEEPFKTEKPCFNVSFYSASPAQIELICGE